jgi:VWFA-related protein
MFFMRAVLLLIVASLGLAAQWPRVNTAPTEAGARPAAGAGREPAATAEEQSPVFRATSSLVRIDTQVLNRKGAVKGLTKDDFVVLDEGERAAVEWFGVETAPLQVVLLFDVSGSMTNMLAQMALVAGRALAWLGARDQVAVIVYGRRIVPLLEFTSDLRAAARMVQEAPLERDVGAGTNMNGAILETLEWMSKQPPFQGRRALVVLTDNRGMHYQTPDEKVLRALAGMDVTLNAIVAPGTRPPKAGAMDADANPDFTPPDVFKLAAETGGEVFQADRGGARFVEMMERVRSRYDLVIRPKADAAGRFRHLEVRLTEQARARTGKVEVNARTGYWAPGQ